MRLDVFGSILRAVDAGASDWFAYAPSRAEIRDTVLILGLARCTLVGI